MQSTRFGKSTQEHMTNQSSLKHAGDLPPSRKIEKKRKQQDSTSFEFIGNGKLKVLETTCNNSMFAVFQYSEKKLKNTSPMEGVLLMKGMDMESPSTHRRKVSKQPTTRKSNKQKKYTNPSLTSTTITNNVQSPLSSTTNSPTNFQDHSNNFATNTNISSSYSKPPSRSSISIKEILN